ncbi:hypothetical protein F2Q68_00040356 [Brassica cretica]|uniref:Uncharacterized protein n=1 Tax=Brassica cretica TaxID=69181 RepID=A0A8S9MLM4_BRACR|nr:hypothetical protein F2Q68_00040356 [Brassica cretica]
MVWNKRLRLVVLLTEEFVNDYIFPCLRAGAIYERKALLVLEIMLEAMVDVVAEVGADAVSHGWEDAVEYAKKHDVPVYLQQGQETSGTLGDILEDLANERKKHMYMMSVDPEDAPDQPEAHSFGKEYRQQFRICLGALVNQVSP